jgi:hypothetical protein
VDVAEVTWSRALFAENLTRLYGQALPVGSEKEQHCGTGPFLLALVVDSFPQYPRKWIGRRRTDVNAATLAAKERYRSWTGGGHRVHATLSPRETEHDLFLFLGERQDRFLEAPGWNGKVRTLHLDVVGAHGWSTVAELLTALDVTLQYVILRAADERHTLELLVDDLWWARVTARANHVTGSRHTVEIAGKLVEIDLRETGDGSLSVALQSTILRERVRDADGSAVPTPQHQLELTLARLGTAGADPSAATIREFALRAGVSAAACSDLAAAQEAHAAFPGPQRDDQARSEGSTTRFASLVRHARDRFNRPEA